MAELQVTEDGDGRWTVSAGGLTVTDLDRETAEAFAAAYRRARAGTDRAA